MPSRICKDNICYAHYNSLLPTLRSSKIHNFGIFSILKNRIFKHQISFLLLFHFFQIKLFFVNATTAFGPQLSSWWERLSLLQMSSLRSRTWKKSNFFLKFSKLIWFMNFILIENFCLVLDSQKGVFSPPYSQTARSNCSVAKETTAKLGLLLVGLFCDMK